MYLACTSCISHFTWYMMWSPRTLINVHRSIYVYVYKNLLYIYVYSLLPRFDPSSLILFNSLRFIVFLFSLFPTTFLQLPSSTIVFYHRGRSRLYFVFHQARIHSDAKQWKASRSALLSPSLLGSLTPWCVFVGLLCEDLGKFLSGV